MAKRWAVWALFVVLSVAALISSLGTAFQTIHKQRRNDDQLTLW